MIKCIKVLDVASQYDLLGFCAITAWILCYQVQITILTLSCKYIQQHISFCLIDLVELLMLTLAGCFFVIVAGWGLGGAMLKMQRNRSDSKLNQHLLC